VEDFTDIDLADFAAEVLPDIAIDQVPCHAVRLTPKAAAQYRRKVVYVAIDGGMLRGTDFTDAQGGLVRQYRLLETRLADGATFPSVSVMRNVPAQTETRLTVETIDATTPLPDKTFNKGNL
jgi:hypothetical protein